MKKSKTTRDQYEKAKKILDRWESKVIRARGVVKVWEAVEQKNKKQIGENILMAIVTDKNGSTIHFEAPIHLAAIDDCESPATHNSNGKETTNVGSAAK